MIQWYDVKDNLPADNTRLYLCCCVDEDGTQRYSVGAYDYIDKRKSDEKSWIINNYLNKNVRFWAYFKYIDE